MTNNTNTTNDKVTITTIRRKAEQNGYKFKGYTECPTCKELGEAMVRKYFGKELTEVAHLVPFINRTCAIKMYKKGEPMVVACTCGHRSRMKLQFREKPQCKVRGCHAVLTKDDNDGLCAKCRNEIAGGGNPATYSDSCTLKPHKGCNFYIQEGKAGCVRINCDYHSAVNHRAGKICNRKGCNNPVPKGRKAVCFSCQAPPKEAASSDFPM